MNKVSAFLRSVNGFWLFVVIITLVWLAWFFVPPFFFPEKKLDPGTAGDMFGSLTAWFSGLAFAGIISTLLMQGRELQLQRDELAQTREVFTVQRFENTLFGLLRLLNDHVASINIMVSKGFGTNKRYEPSHGRDAMEKIAEALPPERTVVYHESASETDQRMIESVEVMDLSAQILSYTRLYDDRYEIYLGPYFRLLYTIMSLIENAHFDDNQENNLKSKNQYAKMVRAHLSSAELKLLLFNCVTDYGRGLKPYVEQYAMLKHLPKSDFEEYTLLREQYRSEAFSKLSN